MARIYNNSRNSRVWNYTQKRSGARSNYPECPRCIVLNVNSILYTDRANCFYKEMGVCESWMEISIFPHFDSFKVQNFRSCVPPIYCYWSVSNINERVGYVLIICNYGFLRIISTLYYSYGSVRVRELPAKRADHLNNKIAEPVELWEPVAVAMGFSYA